MSTLIGGAETYFAKKLANNDLKVRNRALKRLKIWLSKKSDDNNLTEEDFLKIWKGLFYCMWFSDSYLVQENLAENIGGIIHCFQNVNIALLFTRTFFDEIGREWLGIDRLRLDKFYLLIKNVLNSTLECLASTNWNENFLLIFADNLEENYKSAKYPEGIKIFLAEKIIEQIQVLYQQKSNLEFPNSKQIMLLLKPFLNYFTVNHCEAVTQTIKEDIIEVLFTVKIVNVIQGKKKKLSIPLKEISESLLEIGSKTNVNTKNRKALFSYAERFQGQLENLEGKQKLPKKRKQKKKKSKISEDTMENDGAPITKKVKRESVTKVKEKDNADPILEEDKESNKCESVEKAEKKDNSDGVIEKDKELSNSSVSDINANDVDFKIKTLPNISINESDNEEEMIILKKEKELKKKSISNDMEPLEFVKMTPTASFFKKAKSKALSEPKKIKVTDKKLQTMSCQRKVKIELSKNSAISQKDLKISPFPAFSPSKKPTKSALKTPSKDKAIPRRRPRAADFM